MGIKESITIDFLFFVKKKKKKKKNIFKILIKKVYSLKKINLVNFIKFYICLKFFQQRNPKYYINK
jgi:hypothetical protein